jgi:hypothetical protein
MSSALLVVIADVFNTTVFDEAIIQPCCATAHQAMHSADSYLPQVVCYPVSYSHQ